MNGPYPVRGGAPSKGSPGGHIGQYITYAYCPECGLEWVWNSAGIPSSMRNCGHSGVIVVDYGARWHGLIEDVMS